MICFTVTFLIKPGCEKEVMTILREHVNPAKKEPGVGVSHAYRSRTESRRFFIYHELTDQDAFDAHRNTGNYSEFIQTNLYGMLEQESLVMDTKEGRGLPTSTIAPQRAGAGALPPKAIMRMGAEEAVLKKLGLDFEVLDSSCCGMADIFGFEKAHYDMSIKCSERVLLPAVRNAAKDSLIIANGFSCQEQIAQTTDRQALHLAQVIQMALHEGSSGPVGEYPEAEYITQATHSSLSRPSIAVGMSAGLLLLGAVVTWMLRKRKTR